jgi:hypothetical protein
MPRQRLRAALLATAIAVATAADAADTGGCRAASGARVPVLVELYTSEGCDSCPPADRWLSSLKTGDDLIAVAFHVDYWDRLGWKDRFADPRYTERQAAQRAPSGARFVYTPQVLVNGRDWRQLGALPTAAGPSTVRIALQRDGEDRVGVAVQALPGAPARLALWWASIEDGHVSAVGAGENRGATLHHDHVVRRYGEVAAWPAAVAQSLSLSAPRVGEGGRRSHTLVVVTDGAGGAPLQALALGC